MERDDRLALKLERIAQWHAGLRPSEQIDLRTAAERIRSLSDPGGTARRSAGDPAALEELARVLASSSADRVLDVLRQRIESDRRQHA